MEPHFDARTLTLLKRLANDRRASTPPHGSPLIPRTSSPGSSAGARKLLHPLLQPTENGWSGGACAAHTPQQLHSASIATSGGNPQRPTSASLAVRGRSEDAMCVEMQPPGGTPSSPSTAARSVDGSTACGWSLSGQRNGAAESGAAQPGGAAGACRRDDVVGEPSSHGPPQVVFRSPAEKLANPERLNLDRRGLRECPVLEGEERLRLLNYQNNAIVGITNLHNLPHLIFLDLYNNQISRISGLEDVPTLRVLMLGKNQIEVIERLESLRRLDVLDLHCNRIRRLSGLSHLASLRVLNLAGNLLEKLDQTALRGLSSLMELNLRRNLLGSIAGLGAAPCLQRLFLSSNHVATLSELVHLSSSSALLELALDGNPVAAEPLYRQTVLEVCRGLRHLDLRRVNDEERRMCTAQLKRDGEKAAERARRSQAAEERHLAIHAAETAWLRRHHAPADASGSVPGSARAPAPDTAEAAHHRRMPLLDSRRGYAEVSEEGGSWTFSAYGDPSEVVANADRCADVSCASAKFVPIDRIAEPAPGFYARLRRMPQLTELHLSHNDLRAPAQLLALSALPKLTCLRVAPDDNPAVHASYFRTLAVACLPHLRTLNGLNVSAEERLLAEHTWRRLKRLYTLASACQHAPYTPPPYQHAMHLHERQPAGASSKPAAPGAHESAEVAGSFVKRVLGHAYVIHDKITQLQQLWPELVNKYQQRVRRELADAELFEAHYREVACGDGPGPASAAGGSSGGAHASGGRKGDK